MSAFVCKLPINVVIIIIRSLIDSNSSKLFVLRSLH
jgi:hypothetical protein